MSGDWTRTTHIRLLVMLMVLVSVSVASSKEDERPAPMPAQISAAKKAFVSNVGVDPHFKQLGLNRAYNQFYAGLKDWGHYDLVSSPADADVVLEISLQSLLDKYGDKLQIVPVLRLTMLDTKTRTILWVFSEELEAGRFYLLGSHQDEKFDKAMQRIIADVKSLVEPAASK